MALLASCRYGYEPVGAEDDDDGGLPDGSCDPTALLVDGFSAAEAAPRWVAFGDGGASASNVNGRLRVTLPTSGSLAAYAGYVSSGEYSVSGRRVSVEVPTMVALGGHAQVLVQLLQTEGDVTYKAGFEQQNGVLHFFARSPTGPLDDSIAYSPTEHRYWQLREQAGVMFFDTSLDGTAWITQFSSETPFDATQVRIELSAGIYQQELAPGFAEFDNLGGTVTVGASCKHE